MQPIRQEKEVVGTQREGLQLSWVPYGLKVDRVLISGNWTRIGCGR